MKLYVVSGVSGSGKSTALNVFEDLDFYCIDNLPAGLLPAFAQRMLANTSSCPIGAAVGIDARNISDDIANFPKILTELKAGGMACETLFLYAEENVLLKRFSETRRKHPLSDAAIPLAEAMQRERKVLEPIAGCADLFLDTSHYNIHQLRDAIRTRVLDKPQQSLSLLFESFGFKRGVPIDADFVFDVRCLTNPHWVPALRDKTGLESEVAGFLERDPHAIRMLDDIRTFLEQWLPRFEADNRSYITVAIGCTGGQHRSVYIAQRLADHFANTRSGVLARHRELT